MGLGYQKSHRHAATDRKIVGRLKLHYAWMQKFIADGMPPSEASAEALKKVVAGVDYPDERS